MLLRMDGAEELSGDFEWRVAALSTDKSLDLHALLGTHATVEIDHATGARSFDGIVAEAEAKGGFENGFRYDLVLRPWLHVAGLRRNMRIFHNKTVIEIVQEVLSDYADLGDPHLEIKTATNYATLEYTVQYGESDADFLRRQLERHGITWSWIHSDGSHAMQLSDAEFALPEVPGGTRPYYGVDEFHRHSEEHFKEWASGERITLGAVRLTEYNFKTPQAAQEVAQTGSASHARGDVESYDWPGDYLDQGEGRSVVRTRLEGERSQALRHHAAGDVVTLCAGSRVTLGGDDVPGASGRTFICLKAEHRFRAQAYGSGTDSDEMPYEGSYVLLPDDAPLRPERRTVGPRVQGPETAVVVGEGEIDCDEHGRILVRFHWDIDGAHSMRVRVSQNWASKGWGGMVIPRIGMEVIVEHLRGDPDKPIVTGCVYNGANPAPYPLPEHKTKSVFRSDSHKSGGFNEFTFEDATGAENISLHAQKDQTLKVLNNRLKRVDNDQVESVGNNKAIDVGKNHHESIGGSMNLSVGSSGFGLFAAIGGVAAAGGKDALAGSEAVGNKAVSSFVAALGGIGAAVEASTGSAVSGFKKVGNHDKVAGADQASAGAKLGALLSTTMPVSGVMNTVVEKFVSDTIGLARTEQIGAYKNTSVGHTMTVNVGKEFLINCGKSKFIMDSDGNVTIIGTKFNFSASGNVQINGKVIDLN